MSIDFARLKRALNPQCIVVVGDKSPFRWITSQDKYKGKLYSVHVNAESRKAIKALGVNSFASLSEIPEPIDLVIIAVPRQAVLNVIEECIRYKASAAHIFSAGFSETETEEGRALEQEIVTRAKDADFYIIGPNCMGVFNPMIGLRQAEYQTTGIYGPIGFISQSGSHALGLIRDGHAQGVDSSISISYGNGAVLDASDYLEYLNQDPDISVIGIYIEGVKKTARFMSVLKKTTAIKPVVIWKGGTTAEGGRAISSHTGSLTIPAATWEAAMRQCGAISVSSLEELLDTVKVLTYLPPIRGDRIAAIAMAGGQSVMIADEFAGAGLALPQLSQLSYDAFASFWKVTGGGYGNPIDMGNRNSLEIKRILEIIELDTNIDIIAMLFDIRTSAPRPDSDARNIAEMIALKNKTSKPILGILSWHFDPEAVQRGTDIMHKLNEGGIPLFISLPGSVQALKNAYHYYRSKANLHK